MLKWSYAANLFSMLMCKYCVYVQLINVVVMSCLGLVSMCHMTRKPFKKTPFLSIDIVIIVINNTFTLVSIKQ